MNKYIENKKNELEQSKKIEEKFSSFCKLVYLDNKLKLLPDEKKHFEDLREIENSDFLFRKKIFWPL